MRTLVTNGKYLVEPDSPVLDLKNLVEDIIQPKLDEITEGKVVLEYTEDPYAAYVIPKELKLSILRECMGEDVTIKYRAINEDDFQVEGTKFHEYTHILSQDELKNVADEMCSIIERKEELEQKKAAIAKSYGDQIKELELELKGLSKKHTIGEESREAECIVQLNFKEGMKYFYQKDSKEMLTSEELDPNDYQLRIDYHPM